MRAGILLPSLGSGNRYSKKTENGTVAACPAGTIRHRYLPPLLESTRRLSGAGDWRRDVARDKLKTVVGQRADRETVNDLVEIIKGELCWGRQPFRADRVVQWQKRLWQEDTDPAKGQKGTDPYTLPPAESCCFRILAGLGADLWSDTDALAAPLEVFCGFRVDAGAVCEAGWRWGLLARQEADGRRWYRLAPPPAAADAPPDRYLAVRGDQGLTVDLDAVPFDALEALVLMSNQRPIPGERTRLLITPNLVKLGRAAETVAALPLADWLQKNAPTFHQAFETVRQRRGKTILHENLSVARVGDLSLKVAWKRGWANASCRWGKSSSPFPPRRLPRSHASWPRWDTSSRRWPIIDLESIDVAPLDVATELPDLRRDLHVFVDYVRAREVKRSHRGNALSKADAKRLARLLSDPDPDAVREGDEEGPSAWMDFVDKVVLQLGFIHYDTKGQYAGHTSQEPSFPDNYIEFREKPYEQFLAAKAAKQESTLLELLVHKGQGSASEFYRRGVGGRLDGFNQRGSAIGVVPTLDFPAVRRFLLRLLAECPSGQWLSTASLVEHLKKHHRYFLIPAKPRYKNENEASFGRYGNFHESKDAWGYEIDIHERDPDGFERVEGRYVERFLEGIPRVLRYVDVAYAPKPPTAIHPSLGFLKAFRVNDRLRRALEGRIAEPRVVVTPNFDVHVIAETYPAGILAQVAPLCEMVSQDTSIVLKLTKQKVAAARAVSPDLDAADVLRALVDGELPANIVHELSVWSEHGEKFALYVNCSVLETDQDLPAADPFTVEPGLRGGNPPGPLPDKLFDELERRELMTVRIKHGDMEFRTPLPRSASTRFPKGSAGREKPREPRPRVTLTRITRVQLVFPDRELLDKLYHLLLECECPAEIDRPNLTLAYSKQVESAVADAIRRLEDRVSTRDRRHFFLRDISGSSRDRSRCLAQSLHRLDPAGHWLSRPGRTRRENSL